MPLVVINAHALHQDTIQTNVKVIYSIFSRLFFSLLHIVGSDMMYCLLEKSSGASSEGRWSNKIGTFISYVTVLMMQFLPSQKHT